MITPDTIKQFRGSLGWSQGRLAEELGIDQASVSRIERGISEPSRPVHRLIERLIAEIPAPGAPTEAAAE